MPDLQHCHDEDSPINVMSNEMRGYRANRFSISSLTASGFTMLCENISLLWPFSICGISREEVIKTI